MSQGNAAIVSAGPTLTVTATPGTVIDWQRFVIAPGETARFTGGPVVNRVPSGFAVLGTLESNAPVYFLTGSLLSGPGVSMDIAGLVGSTLRLDRLPSPAREGPDGDIRAGQALSNGKVFIIGPGERPGFSRSPSGAVVLAPGTRAELRDLRMPFIRVHVAAPSAAALDVDALVGRRPQIGIFNALFLPPPAGRGGSGETVVASVVAPVEERVAEVVPNDAPVEERLVKAITNDAPVEERLARVIVNHAPVEDRTVIAAAASPAQAKLVATLLASRAALDAIEPGMKIAGPAPVTVAAVMPTAAVPTAAVPTAAVSTAMVPTVVVPAPAPSAAPVAAPAEWSTPAPVRLAAVHKRMPRILFDHKGAIFHM